MLLIVLSLFSAGFSQDEADLYYGRAKNNKFFLKTVLGIGATLAAGLVRCEAG
jgi:hypothetical protein